MPPPTATSTLSLVAEPPLLAAGPDAIISSRTASALGVVAAGYGVTAQLALLLVAVVQLSRAAMRGLGAERSAWAWILAAATVVVLGYFQGYRGFQRRFSPLVAGRAVHLARNPRLWHAVAAPIYVCGLVHATRRRRVSTAILFTVMPLLAVTVARLPEPYRAAVDLGVACGLLWGALAIVVFTVRACAGRPPAITLDLPSSESR
jgi:hypothetical protein